MTTRASTAYDAIVIGAGHNSLVTAGYLAKSGLRTLVVERRERVGGIADTTELAPGARVPTLMHTVGRLRPSVVRDLDLKRHGLTLLAPEVRVFAPSPDGTALILYGDPARTAEGLHGRSEKDAAAYPDFDRRVRVLSRFLAALGDETPPDIVSPGFGDALLGLRLGRAFRGLGRLDARTILRVLPMAVADFVAESFETEALAAAARTLGAEVRTSADVIAVTTADGRATGVALASGEEIAAPMVVSGADPKRTLLDLVDPVTLGPSMRWRAGNIRQPGVVAKVNLVLSGVPRFPAASGDERLLRGRILVAPGIDPIERAFDSSKYGRPSETPVLEATIPSLADPTLVSGDWDA